MIRGATAAVAALICGTILAGEQPATSLSEMTYEIRLLERPVGFERDRITGDAAGQRLESRLDIVDRGTPITSRAHAAGMTVTGHVPRALTAEQGVERGMDQIAHLPIRGDAQSQEIGG